MNQTNHVGSLELFFSVFFRCMIGVGDQKGGSMHFCAKTVDDKLICFRKDEDELFVITEDGREFVYAEEHIAFFLFWIKAQLETDQIVQEKCSSCG